MIRRVLLSLVLLPLAGSTAAAQQSGAMLGGGADFQGYFFSNADQVGIKSLSLLSVPLGASLPLGRFRLAVGGAWARGQLTRSDGSTATLAGMTDTQLALSLGLGDLTLSAFGLVPTGVSRLSQDQADVAGKIAAELLPFPLSNWGSGGGVGLGSNVDHRFGATTLGIGGAYLVGRAYDALDAADFSYRPGNELRARAALTTRVGTAGDVGLQLTVQQSADDRLNGQNLFRSGTRVEALASYSLAAGGRGSALVYGGVLHRSAGTFLTLGVPAAAQDLILAGGNLRLPLGGAVLVPAVDGRLFRSADALGQGWVSGVGAALELPLGSDGVRLVPTVRGRLGSYQVQAGVTSRITGVELGLTLRRGR